MALPEENMTSDGGSLKIKLTGEDAVSLDTERDREAAAAELAHKAEIEDELVNMIETKFEQRAKRRKVKEAQWLRAQRLWLGNLASTKAFSDAHDDPFRDSTRRKRPDFNIVRTKCELALGHIVSMQFAGGEKNWTIRPPNSLDERKVNPLDIGELLEVDQQDPQAALDAQAPTRREVSKLERGVASAARMESEIEEQLDQSDYQLETTMALWNRVVLGTGIMKGPNHSGKLKKSYRKEVDFSGKSVWVPEFSKEFTPRVSSVSPWFVYFDDSTNKISESEDVVQVHPMSRQQLAEKIKHPGFIDRKVRAALEIPPGEAHDSSFRDFASLTDTNPHLHNDKYMVLEYHGPLSAEKAKALGIPTDVEELENTLYGEIWTVNGKLIRVELSPLEGAFSPPYSGSVWEADPASPYGYGIPSLIADSQRVVTSAWHMVLDNASMSSGPQIVVQQSLIEPADGEWELRPGKVWYHRDLGADVSKAFQFFETPNVGNELITVLQLARQFGEEESGVPLINGGMESPQTVSDTATGAALMKRNSTVLLDMKSESWDADVVEPLLVRMYDWNMQYNPKESIKGNFNIVVTSSTEFRNKELHIRNLEKISVETAANPEMAKRINQGALQRARLSMMSLPFSDIIKDEEQVAEEEATAQAQTKDPDPAAVRALADLEKLELDRERVGLEKARLEFEQTLNQRRAELESQDRREVAQVRLLEAERDILRIETEREIALIGLAGKEESSARRDALLRERFIDDRDNKRFLANLQHIARTRDQVLTRSEMELARQTGSGI